MRSIFPSILVINESFITSTLYYSALRDLNYTAQREDYREKK